VMDVEKLLDKSSSHKEKKEGAKIDVDPRTQDKWDLLMEKLLDLEDKIFEAHDADHHIITADSENEPESAQGKAQSNEKKAHNDASGTLHENERAEENKPLASTPKITTADKPPSRTNHMIRETENFAQKVERFYKAQEAQKRRDEHDRKEGEKPAAAASRDRAEL
jgi:hypothetical protein